jgi:hypothetical protein
MEVVMVRDTQDPLWGTSDPRRAAPPPKDPFGHRLSLVSCALGLLLFATAVPSAQAQEKDVFFQLGNLSAYADECGYHKDSIWLQKTFADYVAFMKGRKQTTHQLAFAEVWIMPCGKVKRAVKEVKQAVAQD